LRNSHAYQDFVLDDEDRLRNRICRGRAHDLMTQNLADLFIEKCLDKDYQLRNIIRLLEETVDLVIQFGLERMA
jgi:hypothetical protein